MLYTIGLSLHATLKTWDDLDTSAMLKTRDGLDTRLARTSLIFEVDRRALNNYCAIHAQVKENGGWVGGK